MASWCATKPNFSSSQRHGSLEVANAGAEAADKAVSSTPCVKAALADAGLPKETIAHVLGSYRPYLNWDFETKFLPAVQAWHSKLGSDFASQLEAQPQMLLQTPEQHTARLNWLGSVGLKPNGKSKEVEQLYRVSLHTLQQKLAALEEHGLTASEAKRVAQKHPRIFNRSTKHLTETFDILIRHFGDSARLADILLFKTPVRLFGHNLALVTERLNYFTSRFHASPIQTREGLRHGIFELSPKTMEDRVKDLQIGLGASESAARSMFQRSPQLLKLNSSTILQHVVQLQQLGFGESQLKHMILTKPSILGFDMNSTTQKQKWQFLTDVLHFDTATLAAKPLLFMSSLPNRLGPRWEYLLLARELGVTHFKSAQDVVQRLVLHTDAQIAAMHSVSSALPLYNKAFQQQWQQRWRYLVDDCNIAIADIGRHPAVLQTSLKEVLGPRWAFLGSVSGHHQGFHPIQRLTALATLSDKDFSGEYSVANKCLVYNSEFVQLWQQANEHVWGSAMSKMGS